MSKAILLDTSVLIKLDSKKEAETVADILENNFQSSEYDVHISVITCYEFARTAKDYNEAQRKAMFLKRWSYLDTDATVIKFATVYYNIISKLKKLDDDRLLFSSPKNQFSDADILIGATAVKFNLLIATLDGNDFPRPIFEEQSVFPLNNGKLFVLKPDMDFFERKVTELYKKLPQ